MERTRLELLPGVFLTLVRQRETETACFRAALLRQLSREEAAMNALLPQTLLQGTQRYAGAEQLSAALSEQGRGRVTPLVRQLGEVQAVGFSAQFDNDPAVFPTLMQTLSAILLAPDTRFGQLKKEAVAEALAFRETSAEAAASDPFSGLIAYMCCYEDYAVPVWGEDPEAGPNYYQKLSKHYRAVLAQAPLELYYAGAVPPREAAAVIADCFAAMPRGELDFDLGTDIRMNAVEAEPREENHAGPQGCRSTAVGWRLGDEMEEPEPPVLEALACLVGYLSRGLEAEVRLDVHKGLLMARCDTDEAMAPVAAQALRTVMDTIRIAEVSPAALSEACRARVQALRALEHDAAGLEAFWLEQDLLGLELAPDEYAAFIQETTMQDVVRAAAAAECDAILFE